MNSKEAFDQRNRYFRHRHLTAEDYALEQAYGIERRRLLSRVIAGWGVAQGFELKVKEGELGCGSGLAIDRHGRELVRRVRAPIAPGELVRLDASGQPSPVRDEEVGQAPQSYLLQAHYAERMQGAVRAGGICDCGKQEFNFAQEIVLFSLRPEPDNWLATAQAACKTCGRADANRERPDNTNRRPHACLCGWGDAELLAGTGLEERHGDVCYQLADPVPLALVKVTFDACHKPSFSELDACTPRRLIKTNDMLFDLIRGCDLTTITGVSWAKLRSPEVVWTDFSDYFPLETAANLRGPKRKGDTTFTIEFSRPVQVSTLCASCVSFKVFVGEASGGWMDVKQIPVAGLKPGKEEDGCTSSAVVQVLSDWCDDEIWGRHSVFDEATRVEIEIRGDLILDCNGQAVDATPAGPDRVPSGNGTPGGTYFSSFTVQKRI